MKHSIHCSGRYRDLSALSKNPPPWTHVATLGEFPGEVSIPAGYDVPGHGVMKEDTLVEGLTVFDGPVFDSLIKSFKPDVLIDADHLSNDITQPTEALGWGVELRRAGNGSELELKTPWTPPGRDKITTEVYRYISPEFNGNVRFEGGVFKFYPRQLVGAGLTNRPKLKMLRPVSANRSKSGETGGRRSALLCRLLDAPETTSDESLEKKAKEFMDELATSRNRAAKADELEAEVTRLRDEAIDRDLEKYKDVIGDNESARELLQLNRAATVKNFEAQLARRGTSGGPAPLYQKNRATAPDGRKFFESENGKDSAQRTLVACIQNREKCGFSEAWTKAKVENPGLFD